jgi:hypothetical protein
MLALLPGRAWPAPDCGPAAIIEGDKVEAARVQKLLAARSIFGPAPGCPATKARILRVDRQILIEIEDSFGRLNRRIVSSEEAAATVIESWAYDILSSIEFDAPVLPRPSRVSPADALLDEAVTPAPVIGELSSYDPVLDAILPEPASPPESPLTWSFRGAQLALFGDVSVAGDVPRFGLALRGSARVGPFQFNLLARVTRSLFESVAGISASRAVSGCAPRDENGDGIIDRFVCDNGCSLLDADGDSLIDDRRCESETTGCISLDLNNNGTIDEFQCEPPSCDAGGPNCIDSVSPNDVYRSILSLQSEVGLPFSVGEMQIVPSVSAGVSQARSRFSPVRPTSLLLESSLDFVRPLGERVSLDLRFSYGVSPGLAPLSDQRALRASFGLQFDKLFAPRTKP